MIFLNSSDFLFNSLDRVNNAGSNSFCILTLAARCMAVGMTSLLDCPKFTWLFGCTGS